MNKTNLEYNKLPSYKLVQVIKDCKTLIRARPDYKQRLLNTIIVVREILIKRQVVR